MRGYAAKGVVRIGDAVADAQRAGGNEVPVHGVVVGVQAIGLGAAEQAGHHRIALLPVTADQVGIYQGRCLRHVRSCATGSGRRSRQARGWAASGPGPAVRPAAPVIVHRKYRSPAA